MEPSYRKLGLLGLMAIVFGSMIGGGIFSLPQNMASGAGAGAMLLSWGVTAVGILMLVLTFKTLANVRPDLNSGIYQYAREGFGAYAGFNIAWGYWLCAAFGNVAYIVMLNDSVGAFIPILLDHGFEAAVFGSMMIWTMFYLVSHGMRTASFINTIINILKFGCLVMIVAIMAVSFSLDMLCSDFWGRISDLGQVGEQMRSTMMVTLWCFIGVEGAVIMSKRAKRPSDVGKASVLGFFFAWLLYVMVSALSFGVMSRPELASLPDPSAAYVLKYVAGDWAFYFVLASIIITLAGGLVSWTLICAEAPYGAAHAGIMPARFKHLNKMGMPTRGLLFSTVLMQVFYLIVLTAGRAYMAALDVTGMMVLPAYMFSGLFLAKIARTWGQRLLGWCCVAYCAWTMYAGGLNLLCETSILYIGGLALYVKLCQHRGIPPFNKGEKIALAAIIICFAISLCIIFSGSSAIK